MHTEWSSLLHLTIVCWFYFRCGAHTSVRFYSETGRGRMSRMADQGLTIKDVLHKIRVDLNIPPFLEGQKQLPAEEVKKGRQIASV